MKSLKNILNNAIYEKLKIDDIKISYRFPINQSIKEWVDFLEEHGFVRIDDSDDIDGGNQIIDLLNDIHGRAFFLGENYNYIYLADTSDSDIDEIRNDYYFHSDEYNNFCENSRVITKAKFVKAICDKFGFEL